jgi:copper(I)-binding protein
MMFRVIFLSLALSTLALPVLVAPAPGFAKGAEPHVMDAWVRLPAAAGRPGGGYFMAHGTAKADALVGVSSPKAERIELHSMVNEGGVMKMRAEQSFALPADGTLTFAPGGSHLMLFGLSPDVKAGGKVPLTFTFKSGAKVTVEAEARGAGTPAKESSHQH